MTQLPEVDLLLPGKWWRLPLGDADRLRDSARSLAVRTVGRQDDRAQLRAELAASVLKAAKEAERANASDFYLALEVVPGVPIPISLSLSWPDLPARLSREAGADVEAQSLAASLRSAQPTAEVDTWGAGDLGVVRVTETSAHALAVSVGADGAEKLSVSYWVMTADFATPLVLSFTTSLVSMADSILELCDAIVSTVSWSQSDVSENAENADPAGK